MKEKLSTEISLGLMIAMAFVSLLLTLVMVWQWKSERDFRRYITSCLTNDGEIVLTGSVFLGQRIGCLEDRDGRN